jgi:hypothetical protein
VIVAGGIALLLLNKFVDPHIRFVPANDPSLSFPYIEDSVPYYAVVLMVRPANSA